MSLGQAIAAAHEALAEIRAVKHRLMKAQSSHLRGLMAARAAHVRGVRCGTPIGADGSPLDADRMHRGYVECCLSIDDCRAREQMILDALRENGGLQ